MRGTRAIVLSLLLVAGLLSGCAEGGRIPSDTPTVRGVISDIRSTGDRRAVLVAWAEGAGELGEVDAAHLTVNDETVITTRIDIAGFSAGDELSPEDLKPGMVVEAWVTGAIAESYPIQARASEIDVIGEWDGEIPTPLGLMPETEPQPKSPEGRKGQPGRIETQPAE